MVAGLFALLSIAVWAAGKKDLTVNADAVWHADVTCADAACLVEKMSAGASPAAIEFAGSIGNEGWLRDFRKMGRVDIAYVQYLSHRSAWLLVNGSPSPVDVDNLQKLPKSEMTDHLVWSKLIAEHPRAALFPDDRTTATDPVAILSPDGSQEFVVSYKVLDGCPTCAQLGFVFLGFEFNPKGRFTNTEFIDLLTSETIEPIPVRAGQEFTLALSGDGKQQWSLMQEPARWIVRNVNQTAGEQSSTVFWTFKAISNGTTQMVLRHASPDAPDAAQTLTLRVTSVPGLGH